MAAQKQQPARRVAAALLNQFQSAKAKSQRCLAEIRSANRRTKCSDGYCFRSYQKSRASSTPSSKHCGCTVERIQKKLLKIIRIGVFELVFTPDRADYAIVDAAVEEAKKTGGKKAAGFVNALLRNIGRNIKKRRADLATG